MNEQFEYLYELGKKYPVKVPMCSIRKAASDSHDMLINVQYSKHKELPTDNEVTIQEED